MSRAAHPPVSRGHFHHVFFPDAVEPIDPPQAGDKFAVELKTPFVQPGHLLGAIHREVFPAALRSQQRRFVVVNILHIGRGRENKNARAFGTLHGQRFFADDFLLAAAADAEARGQRQTCRKGPIMHRVYSRSTEKAMIRKR